MMVCDRVAEVRIDELGSAVVRLAGGDSDVVELALARVAAFGRVRVLGDLLPGEATGDRADDAAGERAERSGGRADRGARGGAAGRTEAGPERMRAWSLGDRIEVFRIRLRHVWLLLARLRAHLRGDGGARTIRRETQSSACAAGGARRTRGRSAVGRARVLRKRSRGGLWLAQ